MGITKFGHLKLLTEAKLRLKPSSSSSQNIITKDLEYDTQNNELVSPQTNESDEIGIVQNADIDFVDLMVQNSSSGSHPYKNLKVRIYKKLFIMNDKLIKTMPFNNYY